MDERCDAIFNVTTIIRCLIISSSCGTRKILVPLTMSTKQYCATKLIYDLDTVSMFQLISVGKNYNLRMKIKTHLEFTIYFNQDY